MHLVAMDGNNVNPVHAGWLQERLEQIYKKDPGYSDKSASLFTLDLQSPQELPDNLRGEKWNFVQLPLSALLQELSLVQQVCAALGSVYCCGMS